VGRQKRLEAYYSPKNMFWAMGARQGTKGR
jgi:hypothetical protein